MSWEEYHRDWDNEDWDEPEQFVVENARCVGETESKKALKIVIGDSTDIEYIPKSQIHDDSEVYDVGHEGKLVIPEWLAEKKGWL